MIRSIPYRQGQQLEALLQENVDSAIERERSTFERVMQPNFRDIILFGAGNFGRRILRVLRQAGVQPIAFADNDPAKWYQRIDDLEVLPTREAVKRYSQSLIFVITIFNNCVCISEVIQFLENLNCRKVIPFTYLLWKYGGDLLPYYCMDLPHKVLSERDEVRKCFKLWADNYSREEYLAQVRLRLNGDFEELPAPDNQIQYFPKDIIKRNPAEFFIDCGAYDGDTLQQFIQYENGVFKYVISLEPDPINYQKLLSAVNGLPENLKHKVEALPYAVGSREEKLCFSSTGTDSSKIDEMGHIQIECVTLDNLLNSLKPTYIKMDIEGYEFDALTGSVNIINKAMPSLGICVYHRFNDLWKVPNLINSLSNSYAFYLRKHKQDNWDVVCYAVPNKFVE